VLDFKHIKINL